MLTFKGLGCAYHQNIFVEQCMFDYIKSLSIILVNKKTKHSHSTGTTANSNCSLTLVLKHHSSLSQLQRTEEQNQRAKVCV